MENGDTKDDLRLPTDENLLSQVSYLERFKILPIAYASKALECRLSSLDSSSLVASD